MRGLLVIAAALAVSATLPDPAAAVSPNVSSHRIAPRERPVVSFVTDRSVGGNLWYSVVVKAASPRPRCEIHEEIAVSYASAGQPVSVRFKPWDEGRWCPGRWRGRIFLAHRVSCGEDEEDSFCSSEALVGRFWFRVVR